MPCPMSMRLHSTVVVPSRAMLTKALGCSVGFWPGGTSLPCAWAAAHGSSARPTLPPTLIVTKRRRVMAPLGCTRSIRWSINITASSSDGPRSVVDRGADALIGAAAADVAGHCGIDLRIARALVALEQRDRAHHLPALAVTALRDVVLDPGVDHRAAHRIRDLALDRAQVAASRGRQRCDARAHRRAIEVHGARAAQRGAAAELGAGHADVVAQHPEDRCRRIGVDRDRFAIELE